MTCKEIGAAFGVSEATIFLNMRAALKVLRKNLPTSTDEVGNA
jgi:DNA-directed RNA polymerase specialized sigma subunit